MYRKSDGKKGVNPAYIFGDLPGSLLSSSSGRDPGHISAPQRDSVYLYQLQLSNPCAWTEETLHVSQIIDDVSTSRKVYKQLQKLELIQANGEVVTASFDKPGFGKEYTHHLAIIPQSRQKQIVDFLFWWEGETMRLRKLIGEKTELEALRSTAQDPAQQDRFQSLLNRVQLKIASRPSERVAEMEADEDLVNKEALGHGGEAHAGTVDTVPPPYK